MRQALKQYIEEGTRVLDLTGLFIRFSKVQGPSGERDSALICYLKNDKGNELADHIWVYVHDGVWEGIRKKGLEKEDWISFRGIICPYLHSDGSKDYRIGHVEKLKITRKNKAARIAEEKKSLLQSLIDNSKGRYLKA